MKKSPSMPCLITDKYIFTLETITVPGNPVLDVLAQHSKKCCSRLGWTVHPCSKRSRDGAWEEKPLRSLTSRLCLHWEIYPVTCFLLRLSDELV